MKKQLLLISAILFSIYNLSGQTISRVNTIISQGYDDIHDLYVTPSGSFYVTGQIEYTASFDGFNVDSYGSHDIFLARYDSLGNLIWAKHAGGLDGDIGYSLAVDNQGNTFITGEFESVSNFGGTSKTAQGSNNMFVAKYDPSGNVLWVNQIGTNSGSTIGYAIACDDNGNVYATGTTGAKAYLNGSSSSLFTSRGSDDILLIKFNPSGSKVWHKQIGGTDTDEGYGLAVSGENIYITGSFEDDAKFSSSVTISSDGDKDFFLAKYDTSGNLDWAVSGGGTGDDVGHDIAILGNGKVVCTGEFRGLANFDSHSVTSDGSPDMFVAAYDNNGDNLWVKRGGGDDIDFGNRISTDNNGNVFVGGTFEGDATFGPVTVNSNGAEDVFFVSYDSNGNFRFLKAGGGPDHDRGHGFGSDAYGNLILTGEFWEDFSFDGININGSQMYDGFILRYNHSVGIEENEISSMINIYPNPVHSNLTIHFNDMFPIDNFQVELINSIGEKLKSISISSNEITVPMNEFSNGIYFLKFINNKTGIVSRVSPLVLQKQE